MVAYSLVSKLHVTDNAVVVHNTSLQLGAVADSDAWTILTEEIDPGKHTGGHSHLKAAEKYAEKKEDDSVGVVDAEPGEDKKWHLIPVNYERGYYVIAERIDTAFSVWTVGEPETGGVRYIQIKPFAGDFADDQIFKFKVSS